MNATNETATVEIAAADETIADRGGIYDHAGYDHSHTAEACAAYRAAAIAAVEQDPRATRIVVESARGQRMLHSGWCGAHWTHECGALATMSILTGDERDAISDADDAGRAAARRVIDSADAID